MREDRPVLLLLLRAPETFTKDRGVHDVFGSIAKERDKVGTLYRGTKGDQGRNGAILVRTVDPARHEHAGVEGLIQLARRAAN